VNLENEESLSGDISSECEIVGERYPTMRKISHAPGLPPALQHVMDKGWLEGQAASSKDGTGGSP
jgi:hypothetical protein